jgi:hypothetical protein
MSAAEIHRELCAVYGQNMMSEGIIRQWCRMFKDGQRNVNDEEQSGWPSAVSDDLVQSIDQKICERRTPTISELMCEFPQFYALLSMRFLQLIWALTSFVQDGFQKCSQVHTDHREWLQL